jgi:hypothetical protein
LVLEKSMMVFETGKEYWKKEVFMKHFFRTIMVCFMIFTVFSFNTIQAKGNDESANEQNIQRARERLKDKLLSNSEAVIKKYLDAIGGEEAITSIKTMLIKGRSISLNQEERPLSRYYKQPDRFRQQVPGSDDFMCIDKQKVYYVRNGSRMEMQQPWTKGFRSERIDGNFINYSERKIIYEYIGLSGSDTEPTVFYHLRRTFPDGYYEDLFFDVDSGLLRMIGYPDYPDSFRMFYQYRDIGGILFPMINMRVFNHLTSPHVFVIDEVKVNESYSDAFFGISKK